MQGAAFSPPQLANQICYTAFMNIVLFGGAFNPPHLGHLLVIQQAFELISELDELWILPCYRHTFQKELASSQARVAMVRLLMREIPDNLQKRVKLETVEIDKQLSGETYEALQLMKERYPEYHFSFLMGSDQLRSFTKWGQWEQLLKELPFYVYPRNGFDEPVTLPNMTLLRAETQVITNISSTLIRKRIARNQPLIHLVPEPIIDYLGAHKLYRP
jgi:nicotinate-nucleotide adenylyltransferase